MSSEKVDLRQQMELIREKNERWRAEAAFREQVAGVAWGVNEAATCLGVTEMAQE